jgi:L-seryl-tRNA(Ser) seleniumtransferase
MNLNQQQKEALRNLPAVDHVLELSKSDPFFREVPRSVLIRSIRSDLDNRRRQIIEQDPAHIDELLADASVVTGVKNLVRKAQSLNLRETVNATGIVIHTNLGRSLLSDSPTLSEALGLEALSRAIAGNAALQKALWDGSGAATAR